MSGDLLFIHVNEWARSDSPDALPVSCGYILAALKQHGFSGRILGDYQGAPLSPQTLADTIRKIRPLALGFSVYEENIQRVRLLARFAKHLQPDLPVVLGGPQVTFMPSEALEQMTEADILCRGEGEVVMPAIARALAEGGDLGEVPGIAFIREGTVIETPREGEPGDLDAYPSPWLTHTIDPGGKQRVILFSSRGCASPCTFCYTPRAGGYRVRFHSPERIIEEMSLLTMKGITDFWFADPNIAFSRERFETLLHAIRNHVPGIGFWCQTRYNLVDRDLLQLLKEAGAHTIAFGLESASPVVLRKIRKGLDTSKLSRAIRLAQDAGLKVELFTQFGLPGETSSDARETLRFVREHEVAVEGNSISQQMHLFFGAPVADTPEKHGILPHSFTRPAYLSACRDFRTTTMSEAEIRKMSVLWRLHRTDFQEDVQHGRNLFAIAGFINGNRNLLDDCPEADMLLARIYMALDEPQALADRLARLERVSEGSPETRTFIEKSLVGFRSRRRARAAPGCRIIFDCTGRIGGREIPETVCRYHLATLGSDCLIPDFDQGMEGVKAGSATAFKVCFPADYHNPELAGQRADFQVYLHQVLEPVAFGSVEELRATGRRNMYRIDDLPGLKTHNENLYYMVLRDSVLHTYTGNLTDSIALFSFLLKLGFVDQAMDLAWSLPDEPSIIAHVGKILLVNNHPQKALEFLDRVAGSSGEIENQRIKALVRLEQYEKAERLASNPLLATNIETMSHRVRLASMLRLPVEEYLARMERMLDTQARIMAAQVAQ
ncbi:MAG: hypothetical protein Kow0089_06950 [Desulfobulbaceae bacterium]